VEFEFAGVLIPWRGPAPFHFIALPDELVGEVRAVARHVTYGWGVIPVSAQVGDTRFTTSLFPKDGGYLLPIKDAVRHAEALALGDVAVVRLTIAPPTG
jgi:hypothetical protein